MRPLSEPGERALVALLRYVMAHGNVSRDARWIAAALLDLCHQAPDAGPDACRLARHALELEVERRRRGGRV